MGGSMLAKRAPKGGDSSKHARKEGDSSWPPQDQAARMYELPASLFP